jgi:hypothetical protein
MNNIIRMENISFLHLLNFYLKDQTRPDQTRPDQTRPDQTRPDKSNQNDRHD